MTPLAQEYTRHPPEKFLCSYGCNRTAPPKIGEYNLDFNNYALFEVSNVLKAANEWQGPEMIEVVSRNIFLPSQKTALEWIQEDNSRVIAILEKEENNINISCIREKVLIDKISYAPTYYIGSIDMEDKSFLAKRSDEISFNILNLISKFLCFINSPRTIGRKLHMPHAGLQKEIARKKGLVGKFPLKAWTEIKLEVTAPKDESQNRPRDTILTGDRALHFVRAHLRIRNGMLIYVSPHWRGNPAMGIKRTRYSVHPPKNGIWPSGLKAISA